MNKVVIPVAIFCLSLIVVTVLVFTGDRPKPKQPEEAVAGVNGNWKTLRNDEGGVQMSYPGPFPATYIETTQWPPVLSVDPGLIECEGAVDAFIGPPTCVVVEREGAAGSVYTRYEYYILRREENVTIRVEFGVRELDCTNFEGLEREACEKERDQFDLEALSRRMLESVVI